MRKSENRNPCVYTGNEMTHRVYSDIDDNLTSRFVSIMGVTERGEGGLIFYLEGDNGNEYSFELESGKGGESVRRQFLYDLGVFDIFDNIWDLDHRSLLGKKIEAFVNKKGECIGVSPIFIALQNKSRGDLNTEKELEEIVFERLNVVEKISSEIDGLGKYKHPLGILYSGKRNIEGAVRDMLALKLEYMQSTGQTQAPAVYYEFVNKAAKVFDMVNKRIEVLESRKGLHNSLDNPKYLDASVDEASGEKEA